MSGKGTSYLITPFFNKSATKSGMITALYVDRRQNQNWHLNLNIQNCWYCGTQLPLLKLCFFLLWTLILMVSSLGCWVVSLVAQLTPHHCSYISDIQIMMGSLWQHCFSWGWHRQNEPGVCRKATEILFRDKNLEQT